MTCNILKIQIDNPTITLITILAIAVTVIVGVAYFFNKKKVVLRKLKKFKVRKITQLQSNELSKVSGKVLHVKEPLVTPLSKRKCVAHILKIEQKKSTGKSYYWKKLVDQERFQEFFLEKDGEVVLIRPENNPKNYISYLIQDHKTTSGFLKDPTPEFEKVLSWYGIESTNLLGFNKSLRYTERIIEVGEYITVGGIAKWKAVDDSLPDFRYSKIAALESSENQKLIITDCEEASDRSATLK